MDKGFLLFHKAQIIMIDSRYRFEIQGKRYWQDWAHFSVSWFCALDKVWSKNMESSEIDLTSLTADIVSAYVAHNALTGDKVSELISPP